MKLGFIGTGQIAKATILGILGSNLKINQIYISQRNKKISSQLSKKSKKIIVLKNNQEIINNSNWIFLSITPGVGEKILKNLKFTLEKIKPSFGSYDKRKLPEEEKPYWKLSKQLVESLFTTCDTTDPTCTQTNFGSFVLEGNTITYQRTTCDAVDFF